ncbi:MAG: glycosyltransferase [Steroidobacteraceae bacterium]
MTTLHAVDPDITLLIPTLGREILRGTLLSVIAGEAWPVQTVIVDQGRQAGIARLTDELRLRGLDILYIPSDRIGRSVALNTGMARVATRFVVITDDDCQVATDWLARMGERLRRHEPAIVTGRVEAGAGEVQLSVVTTDRESIQRRPAVRFDRLSGGNMGMPLTVPGRIGSFSEDALMRFAEDTEFAYRALRAQVPIVYAPEAVVRHLGWRDGSEREQQYRNYARSHSVFFGRQLRKGDGFICLRASVHLLRATRRWLSGALRGDAETAAHGKAYVTEFLPGLRAGWRSGAAP